MRITDELRRYISGKAGSGISLACEEAIANIADRIDERVDNIRFNEHQKGYQDGIRDGRSCEWDYWESTHIELPKDADGEYIHIGDEVDTEHFGTVDVIGFTRNSVVFYNYSEQPAYLCITPRTLCRRHHEPTVEGLLQKMIEEAVGYSDAHTTVALSAITEYAEKLREVVKHERD